MLMDKAGFMGEEGGGGSDDPPSDPPPSDDPPSEGPEFKWPEGLEEDYRGRGDLTKFAKEDGSFDVAKIMKSYVHANQALSTDKIPVPTKHFTEDQWKETYEKLGLPKELEKYEIENKVPEGLEADEEFFTNFKKVAHEAGVLPKQAQKLVDYYNETMGNAIREDIETSKTELEQGKAKLKEEWGDAYNRKLENAEKAFSHFASEDEIEGLKKTGIFNNPTFSRVFAKIADAMDAEDTFNNDAAGKLTMTVDEITTEIDSLRNSEQYKDVTHPRHKATRDRMTELYNRRSKAKSRLS